MTDEELNKYIHEKVMGECCHEWGTSTKDFYKPGHPDVYQYRYPCTKCPYVKIGGGWPFKCPDYCNSLDAVSKAEAKVIEKDAEAYLESLAEVVALTIPIETQEAMSDGETIVELFKSTARQRAEAIYKATEGGRSEGN